jgi:hypothetical protein
MKNISSHKMLLTTTSHPRSLHFDFANSIRWGDIGALSTLSCLNITEKAGIIAISGSLHSKWFVYHHPELSRKKISYGSGLRRAQPSRDSPYSIFSVGPVAAPAQKTSKFITF